MCTISNYFLAKVFSTQLWILPYLSLKNTAYHPLYIM